MDTEPTATETSAEPTATPGGSGTPNVAATKPKDPKQLPTAVRMIIVVVIGLIILAIQAALNNLTVQRAREDEMVAGVQAVAAALRPVLLGSEKDRARVVLEQVIEAGDYQSAVIIKDGSVWASSGASNGVETGESKFFHAKGETTAGGTENGFMVTTGIMAGPENPAGYLQVKFKP